MKTVIFDVDGVLLSEKRYFDVSGLALWEWYNSPLFLGIGEEPVIAEPTEEKIEALRRHYWADDELLRRFKRHGINSNWDMVYLFAVCSFLVAAQGDANLFRGLSADFSTPPALRKLGTALRRLLPFRRAGVYSAFLKRLFRKIRRRTMFFPWLTRPCLVRRQPSLPVSSVYTGLFGKAFLRVFKTGI